MSDPGASNTPIAKGVRGSRACHQCSKRKKKCDGADPCSRCSTNGELCTFDKPAETASGALERIKGLECSMEQQQGQIAELLEHSELISAQLSDILIRLGPLASPSRHPEYPISMTPGVSSSPTSPHPLDTGRGFSENLSSRLTAVKEVVREAEESLTYDPLQGRTLSAFEPGDLRAANILDVGWKEGLGDIVTCGIVDEAAGKGHVAFWMKQLQCYCPVLDPAIDTFASIRARSPILLSVLISTAARMKGPLPPEKLTAISDHARAQLAPILHDVSPPLETLQALLAMATWHDDAFLLVALASRICESLQLDRAAEELERESWDSASDSAQLSLSRLRAWLQTVVLSSKYPKIIQTSPRYPELSQKLDLLINSPHAIQTDKRLLANYRMCLVEQKFQRNASRLETTEKKVEYMAEVEMELFRIYEHYDGVIASDHPSPKAWSRAIQYRQLQGSRIFLRTTLFRNVLLDQHTPSDPAILDVGRTTLEVAFSVMENILSSPAYTFSLQYSSFNCRAELVFAATMAMEMSARFPELSPPTLVADVSRLAELFTECSAPPKLPRALRHIRDKYLSGQLASAWTAMNTAPEPDESVKNLTEWLSNGLRSENGDADMRWLI